jgi:hypothetical protein
MYSSYKREKVSMVVVKEEPLLKKVLVSTRIRGIHPMVNTISSNFAVLILLAVKNCISLTVNPKEPLLDVLKV